MDDKNQYVSGLTVGPSCFLDDRKRRKQRFTLFNAALGMIKSSPNEKTSKNKKSIIRKDDKINGNKNSNGKNTKGSWKQLVGSMRPLHMQASQSPSSSPQHSKHSDSALSCPLPSTPSSISSTNRYPSPASSSISSTSRYFSPTNNPQELENMGTMSTSVSPNNLRELASTGSSGTMSTRISPNNLQELSIPGSSGTMSPSVSTDNLQEVEGTMSHINTASSNDFQELPNRAGGMSTSISAPDNLQEVAGTMSPSVSANNLADLTRAGSMRKHNISSGNLGGLGRKGKMSSSKSTSDLQYLSSGMMRQYKSALNLHDLDLDEEIEAEEDSDDKLLENCAADVMIDVKADQFIKNFYQQMHNQHKGKGRRHRNSYSYMS